MDHIIKFEPGHDCIHFECRYGSQTCKPNLGGSHGVHGLTIRFVSKDIEGAVNFTLYTGWLPQHVVKDTIGYRYIKDWGHYVMPADLGYHSKTPHYEGQHQIDQSCDLCDNQPCYYDGSSLNATDAMYALVNKGIDALWEFLDAFYISEFKGGEYPTPAEYPMPPRKEN